MGHRWRVGVGVGGGLLLVAAAGLAWVFSRPPLTGEQIDRASALDMEAEVEAVLGPGRLVEAAVPVALGAVDGENGHAREWAGNGW